MGRTSAQARTIPVVHVEVARQARKKTCDPMHFFPGDLTLNRVTLVVETTIGDFRLKKDTWNLRDPFTADTGELSVPPDSDRLKRTVDSMFLLRSAVIEHIPLCGTSLRAWAGVSPPPMPTINELRDRGDAYKAAKKANLSPTEAANPNPPLDFIAAVMHLLNTGNFVGAAVRLSELSTHGKPCDVCLEGAKQSLDRADKSVSSSRDHLAAMLTQPAGDVPSPCKPERFACNDQLDTKFLQSLGLYTYLAPYD
jgi:hypothetical protein